MIYHAQCKSIDEEEEGELNLKLQQEGKKIDPEGLEGENWEKTKWKKPEIEIAEHFANKNRYKRGKGSCFNIDVESLGGNCKMQMLKIYKINISIDHM